MIDRFKYLLLVGGLVWFNWVGIAVAEEAVATNDLAVLIDVSGSMKNTDPKNLRIPAMKLLINLLPEKTKATVWLFAEDTKVLIAAGEVNAAWKENALTLINKIHSKGLFTNIETALQTAHQQWAEQPASSTRNVLLLTDGVVDVAKDKQQNLDSKSRILNELLPKIQASGAHIQAIALSKQADSELLQKLAISTQGWSETVESAQQLERIFVKMFQQALPQASVALEGNKFKIDSSIKEFSVLVFRKAGAATALLPPGQPKMTRTTQSEQLKWISEQHYDLMTVKAPAEGEWQIEGEIDPDNKVMILTDLSLDIQDLPLYKTELEPVRFEAHFSEKGEVIARDDFLKLVTIQVEQTDGSGKQSHLAMTPIPTRKGFFEASLTEHLPKGNYSFKLLADGKTFTREISRNLAVIDSSISLKSSVDSAKRQVTISLIPDANLIDPATLSVAASVNQLLHPAQTIEVPKHGDKWEITVELAPKEEQKIINWVVKAKTKEGKVLEPALQPFLVDEQLFTEGEPAAEVAEHHPEATEATDAPHAEVPAEKVEAHAADKPAPNWLMTSLVTLGINLIFIGLGYWLYKMYKKHTANKQALLLDRLK